jgi:hypothetical protein
MSKSNQTLPSGSRQARDDRPNAAMPAPLADQVRALEDRSATGTSAHDAALVIAMRDARVREALDSRMRAGSVHLGVTHPAPNRVAFHFAPAPGTMSLETHSLAVDVDPATRSVAAIGPLTASVTQLVSVSLSGGMRQGAVYVNDQAITLTVDTSSGYSGIGSANMVLPPPSVTVVYTMAIDGPTTYKGTVTINGVTKPEGGLVLPDKTSFPFTYPLSAFGL